jgi:saccharopine dehydrogenase-like NADP-dependent oxidoreductase
MKILSLGAGGMGEAAAVAAASFEEIREVIVADLNLENAQRVAARCGGKATAARIDVTRHDDLVALMRQADATMNCVGPFFRFGVPILRAALDARRHYFDICDDPEPTLEMLRMDAQAREAGVTAVVAGGASPGVTNLLARLAYESLDTVDELVTAWSIEDSDPDSRELAYSMAIVHWMQQISGKILEWREHGLQNVRPLREELVRYPGRGDRTVWTVGHPEPIALSQTYPGLNSAFCVMIMSSIHAHLFRRLQAEIDQGQLTLEQAAHELVAISQRKSWWGELFQAVAGWFDGPAMPQFFALARGTHQGVRATTAASIRAYPADMADATGVPLAITARLFAQGKITAPGVHPPEKVIDPQQFFDLFHPYCVSPKPVTRDALVDLATEHAGSETEACALY